MIFIRDNVEKIAESGSARAEKLLAEGYKAIEGLEVEQTESTTPEAVGEQSELSKKTLEDLKALAAEKGIDITGMKKPEIMEALKDVM